MADFDGDGDPDVAVPGLLSDDLTVLRNDGGELVPAGVRPEPGGPLATAIGDFDGDGLADLALSLPTAAVVRVRRGDTALAFGLLAEIPVEAPGALAAGDVDGDGDLDLVVLGFEPGRASLLRNDGDSGFALEPFPLPYAPAGCSAAAIGDVDGDGAADLAVTGANEDALVLYRGGDAYFLGGTSAWPSAVVVAELDRDPELELVGTANLGAALFVADWAAGGPLVTRAIPSGAGPIALAAADLDRDGDVDVAVAQKFENTIGVYANDGEGRLAPVATLPARDGPTPIAAADVDGDGWLDLVVAHGFSNDLVLYLAR